MAEDKLVLSFGDLDGEKEFRSWDRLERWLSTERAKWDWLDPANGEVNVGSIAQHVRNGFDQFAQTIINYKAEGIRSASRKTH